MPDLSHMSVWLAGEVGQVSLARTGEDDGWRAAVDQHAADVREVLGGRVAAGPLLGYAHGFIEACVARGWWPPHRDMRLDWESLRLAAVCHLFLETQGIGLLRHVTNLPVTGRKPEQPRNKLGEPLRKPLKRANTRQCDR